MVPIGSVSTFKRRERALSAGALQSLPAVEVDGDTDAGHLQPAGRWRAMEKLGDQALPAGYG